MMYGIDTSKWQKSKVDYAKAKRSGYNFVFLRIGCGSTKDKCFEKDYASAKAAGLRVGVYFYTYATSVVQAKYDASRVLGWLDGRVLDLPVVYDMEEDRQMQTNRAYANSNLYNSFSSEIRKSGYKSMLYTSEYFANNYFAMAIVNDPLWIAKYSTKKPAVKGKVVNIWQCSSSLKATFYSDNLDQNVMLKDEWADNTTIPENPYPVPTRTLKYRFPMMKGEDVKWVQTIVGAKVDGYYGKETKTKVIAFQMVNSLLPDGIVGSATRTKMKAL